jgi:hypothetical protein
MIIGAHSIIFSTNPEADRAFLRDVLHLPNVDAGEGWLIFGLPPAEVAVHPYKHNNIHKFYLMCDDVEKLITEIRRLVPFPTQLRTPGGAYLHISLSRAAENLASISLGMRGRLN